MSSSPQNLDKEISTDVPAVLGSLDIVFGEVDR